MNSAFPSKKNLAQKRSLFTTNKFESKCLQKFYVSSKHEKECYIENNVLPRGTESPFLSALHAKNDTTNHATADKRTHALLTETAFNHQLSTKQPSNVTTITLLKNTSDSQKTPSKLDTETTLRHFVTQNTGTLRNSVNRSGL